MESQMPEPVTERVNPRTQMIDVAFPEDMVRMLEECDAEMFDGWENSKGIFDEKTRQTLCHLVPLMRNHMQDPEATIVISGCGTSGRLAFLVAVPHRTSVLNSQTSVFCYSQRTVNAIWKPSSVEYLIAGGDKALFTSQEAQEDEPIVGIEDLKKVSEGKKSVLYLGVTCGLSAPYVAGQLHHCMQHLDIFTPVLIGFNPLHLARQVTSMLCSYREVRVAVNKERKKLSEIAEKAGQSLLKGGSITYLSDEDVGIVGMIDASECPPTFGADSTDVRCFLKKGFELFGNKNGDMSDFMKISLENFKEDILPSLTTNDLIIHLSKCDHQGRGSSTLTDPDILKSAATNVSIEVACGELTSKSPSSPMIPNASLELSVSLPAEDLFIVEHHERVFRAIYVEMAFKWICNAVTTVAHVIKGKIFSNNMIDVCVS
ncbi:hypothetical protein CAPTEDRAFT_226744 [Capitella teleta]|uniref:SIS domain-containing protein n=1 Tax=Capitella teleta TaxID=283909 RepID=N1PB66_CAPTE|nr:hypothetical protein CAPTEDRAFT_226744 [Capitella teleta]|eukprot:ELU18821.1 hypothetical protein CAPTEDRAFT_226744 [Capitella teleta]